MHQTMEDLFRSVGLFSSFGPLPPSLGYMRMSTAGRPGGIGAEKERREQKQSTNVLEGE